MGPAFLVRAGLLIVLATAAVGTPADADLWGHLAFGRDIVASRSVIQTDPYSFTSDRPWVNHEWLSEVVFFETYRLGGTAGLVVLKLVVIGVLLACLRMYLKGVGLSAGTTMLVLTLAFAGTYWRTHNVRPQLFSVLFFAVLLIAMTRADAGRRRALLVVPPLMALWVNLHGGWILGLGVYGGWSALRTVDWRTPVRDRLVVATAGLAALGATLCNPYGARLWAFLAETVRPERGDIEEWGSVLSYSSLAFGIPWALSTAAAVLALWRSPVSPRRDYLAVVAGLALLSFRVGRVDAFFTLAVVVLLAPQFAGAWRSAARAPAPSAKPLLAQGWGMAAVTAVALGVMLVPAARIAAPYATCLTIAGSWAPDAHAARFISLNQLQGRMLTWFDWGEYAIWHFGPALQVSMDGRRETVYLDDTILAHRRFYAGDDTALPYVRALQPDYIWLPAKLPVASQLADAGWTPVFQGPVSSVFARVEAGPFRQVAESATASVRCFPGP